MKFVTGLIKGIVAFFADDLLTAGLVLAWCAVVYVIGRYLHHQNGLSILYLVGILAALGIGVWRRAKLQS